MNFNHYIIIFYLAYPKRIKIGKLGTFNFPSGYYVYVGKDHRSVRSRVARHLSLKKRARWHIDYLSREAIPIFTLFIQGKEESECEIGALIKDIGGQIIVPGFGASDCRCSTHLMYFQCIPKNFYMNFRPGGDLTWILKKDSLNS